MASVGHLEQGELVLLPTSRQFVTGRHIVGATIRVRNLASASR